MKSYYWCCSHNVTSAVLLAAATAATCVSPLWPLQAQQPGSVEAEDQSAMLAVKLVDDRARSPDVAYL
jgi:hypothetical protein